MDPAATLDPLRQHLITCLDSLAHDLVPVARGRGRPPILSDAHLWGCTLITVLDGTPTQRGIWREVSAGERWRPPVPVAWNTMQSCVPRNAADIAVTQGVVTPNIVRPMAGLPCVWAMRCVAIPAIASAAFDKMTRDNRFSPARSVTAGIITISEMST